MRKGGTNTLPKLMFLAPSFPSHAIPFHKRMHVCVQCTVYSVQCTVYTIHIFFGQSVTEITYFPSEADLLVTFFIYIDYDHVYYFY